MAFTKKTWVNVPDPSNLPSIPEGQDSLARFDATNMNRIEEGINDAHALIKDHGLGSITPTALSDVITMMQRGCGFYSTGNSNDSPKGTSEWLSMLQTVRSPTEGSETGSQIVFYDFSPNKPQMWLRTMASGIVGNWVEMIHTGNMFSLLPFARISSGTYVGDGAAGIDNPNSLTFDFVPKIVFVSSEESATSASPTISGSINGGFAWIKGMTKGLSYGHKYSDGFGAFGVKLTWNNKTVSWYNADSTYQLNQSGKTYYYVAIG